MEGCAAGASAGADAGFGHEVSGTKGSTREKPVQANQTHLLLVILVFFGSHWSTFVAHRTVLNLNIN